MYGLMYTKSLNFPLGVTLMSYKAASKLSGRTVRAIIGAMKLNRSSPRVLAFAPKDLHGLGMRHHYTVQGTMHLKQIIQHVWQQDENGKMYNMIFDYAQLMAGIQFPILQYPSRRLPHMKEPWEFLNRCRVQQTEHTTARVQPPKTINSNNSEVFQEFGTIHRFKRTEHRRSTTHAKQADDNRNSEQTVGQ
jgi:hypothetical protein